MATRSRKAILVKLAVIIPVIMVLAGVSLPANITEQDLVDGLHKLTLKRDMITEQCVPLNSTIQNANRGQPMSGLSPKLQQLAELMSGAMNASADPCEDFHAFACGGFQSTFKLPADFDEWWMNENVVEQRIRGELKAILKDNWPIVSPYYASCMDVDRLNVLGSGPLRLWTERIQAVQNASDIISLAGSLHKAGIQVFFAGSVLADPKSPTKNVFEMNQGGIALPDQSMYSDRDSFNAVGSPIAGDELPQPSPYRTRSRGSSFASRKVARVAPQARWRSPAARRLRQDAPGLLKEYKEHVATMLFMLFNYMDGQVDVVPAEKEALTLQDARALAELAVRFEADLASGFTRSGEDVVQSCNRINLDGLLSKAPTIPWAEFFASAGNDALFDVITSSPKYWAHLAKTIANQTVEATRAYLLWQLVHGSAKFLSTKFVTENFRFFDQILEGSLDEPTREFHCVQGTDDELGQLLGHYYALNHFSPDARQYAVNMMERVKNEFVTHLGSVSWMDDASRSLAAKKMFNMRNQIGYPEHWQDFNDLHLAEGQYLQGTFDARTFQYVRLLAQVGKPVDPDYWTMSTSTVNAYFAPELNTMVMPAGQLQDPDFDPEYPLSANYGVTGFTMGHEITHGFDSDGTHYDETGKLSDHWFPKAIQKTFEEKGQCVVKLYDRIRVAPGLHVDGKQTEAENIADIGGIKIAYWAYLRALDEYAAKFPDQPIGPFMPSILQGLSDEQLFFLAFAQEWCVALTPGRLRTYISSNEHAPPPVRCNAPLRQFPAFADAYRCPAGSPMRSPEAHRCDIWW